MRSAILNFAKQFSFEPKVENAKALGAYDHFIVAGMGGSHLAADLLLMQRPELALKVHADYGLPARMNKDALVIASSYSGNTEETLDAYASARKRGLAVAAIAVGGKLLELAKKDGVPYVMLPDTGIQPRSALGFSLIALLAIIGDKKSLRAVGALAKTLDPSEYEPAGKELAAKLRGRVPVIYASSRNAALAYNWKIKFNETGKIPAFLNVLPELNHNEMTGFDVTGGNRGLAKSFHFLFLADDADHPRVQKRMEVLQTLYEDRGLPVERIDITDADPWHGAFASLLLADWTALALADAYGLESEQVPMVEEFKKRIK
jgi:glucose/mannose-6-phosphate isomerase